MECLNAQPHPAFPLNSQPAGSKTGHGEELLPLALLLCQMDAQLGTGEGREKHCSGFKALLQNWIQPPWHRFHSKE